MIAITTTAAIDTIKKITLVFDRSLTLFPSYIYTLFSPQFSLAFIKSIIKVLIYFSSFVSLFYYFLLLLSLLLGIFSQHHHHHHHQSPKELERLSNTSSLIEKERRKLILIWNKIIWEKRLRRFFVQFSLQIRINYQYTYII